MTPAQFWQIEMQNQQNQQEQQQQNQKNIMSGIMGIADDYAENKQLEAKAGSYDDIGKILNTAMFKDNPDAAAAFGNLQKEKDPRKKVMGYEQLFSLVGPMSNAMMAGRRVDVTQQGQQAATDRMYEAERLRRERELMNKPPQSNSTFTGGSTVRGLFNTQ